MKKDTAKAIALLKLAAKQNYAVAQYQLGKIYIQGKLVKRDIEKGLELMKRAAKQGYRKAIILMRSLNAMQKLKLEKNKM